MFMNRQNSRHIIIMQHQFALIYANEVHEYITRAHEYITVCRDANGYAKSWKRIQSSSWGASGAMTTTVTLSRAWKHAFTYSRCS